MKNFDEMIPILAVVLIILIPVAAFFGFVDGIESDNKIEWPDTEIGHMIPEPECLEGSIDWENEMGFGINIQDYDMYNDYVKECIDYGFTYNVNQTDDFYGAENKFGYQLVVQKISLEQSIFICLQAPSEPVEEKVNENGKTEFEEVMDQYEQTIDEYCSFMNTYQSAETITPEMSEDYVKYTELCTDTINKLNNINMAVLTDEQILYFQEVQSRILQKVSAISK